MGFRGVGRQHGGHFVALLFAVVWSCCGIEFMGQSKLDTAALYEELYSKQGYHADLSITHARDLVSMIEKPHYRRAVEVNGVLDIGCSHGRGVQLLWEKNISASGMDISATAVNMAKTHRPDPMWCGVLQKMASAQHCCRGACFKVGSATKIPFEDHEFDAIMTTDVLEHLLPEDVPLMVQEFKRVASTYVFVSVAVIEEKEKKFLTELRQYDGSHRFEKVNSLHTTVLQRDQWIKAFEDGGMTFEWGQKCKHCSPQVLVFRTSKATVFPRVFRQPGEGALNP